MPTQLQYAVADIGAGWIGILGSDRGLRRLTLPQPTPQKVKERLGVSLNNTEPATERFRDLLERLRSYFSGQEMTFPDELDLSAATPFQRYVWEKSRLVPYGETRSYSWLAGQIGQPNAARATGQALGRNPLPIIVPCHRIITAEGGLGGYSGGLDVKRHLLQVEASGRAAGPQQSAILCQR